DDGDEDGQEKHERAAPEELLQALVAAAEEEARADDDRAPHDAAHDLEDEEAPPLDLRRAGEGRGEGARGAEELAQRHELPDVIANAFADRLRALRHGAGQAPQQAQAIVAAQREGDDVRDEERDDGDDEERDEAKLVRAREEARAQE